MIKECSKCKNHKDVILFNKNKKNTTTGRSSWCKACIKKHDASKNYKPIYRGTKICQTCKITKKATEFHVNKKHKDGLERRCKKCNMLRKDNNHYRNKYGITLDDYNNLIKSQNYQCAICKTVDPGVGINRFHVDHNHSTGVVRGLLCSNCNRALGQFKDDISILESAAEYIRNNLETKHDFNDPK